MQAEIKAVCQKRAYFLTDSLLEYENDFAILARMNGFRVTILVLLALTVGLMFYVFVVLLPARQDQYQMYQTQLKINEYEKRQQEHEARMARLGADADTPEVAAARAAAEAEEKKNAADLTAAEEQNLFFSEKPWLVPKNVIFMIRYRPFCVFGGYFFFFFAAEKPKVPIFLPSEKYSPWA